MYHFNAFLPDDVGDYLQRVIRPHAGMSMSEYARRLFQFGQQEHVFNTLVPTLSGQGGQLASGRLVVQDAAESRDA